MDSPATTNTPYLGLAPYEEKDAPFFFGRDREREIISANFLTNRLTVLYGPSGVGKSSVLRAGVVPYLRNLSRLRKFEHKQLALAAFGDDDPRPATAAAPDEREEEYIAVYFKEWRDEDPLLGLLDAISMAAKGEPFNPDAPRRLVQQLKELTAGTRTQLLIILDQFEDYFLFHAEESDGETFASEFPHAVINPNLPVNFLISIREDWLSRLDLFTGYIPRLFDNRIRIEHLDRKAAAEAITRPVEKYNRTRAEGQPEVTIVEPFTKMALSQLEELDERVLSRDGVRGAGRSPARPGTDAESAQAGDRRHPDALPPDRDAAPVARGAQAEAARPRPEDARRAEQGARDRPVAPRRPDGQADDGRAANRGQHLPLPRPLVRRHAGPLPLRHGRPHRGLGRRPRPRH